MPSTGPIADTGLLGFYAATGAGDVAGLMPVALDCLAAATEDLSEAEVRRAKAQMKVSLLAALESPGARSEQIARQLLAFGRVLSREEMIAQVEALSLADIRAAGANALASPPSVASIGPVAKVMTPDRIRDRLGGFGGSRTWRFSGSALPATMPHTYAATVFISVPRKCGIMQTGPRFAISAANS